MILRTELYFILKKKHYKNLASTHYADFKSFLISRLSNIQFEVVNEYTPETVTKPKTILSFIFCTVTTFIRVILLVRFINTMIRYSPSLSSSQDFTISKRYYFNISLIFSLGSFFWFYIKSSGFYLSVRFLIISHLESVRDYLFGIVIPRITLSLILSSSFFVFACLMYKITFLRVVGGWLLTLFFAYWLLSGFNHFLKRYKFGSFTSAIQRFWKRAYICFWMIEGFMFVLFFYYTMNTSQEPTFMLDQVWLYNKQIWSIKSYMLSFSLIVSCILLLNLITLQLKFSAVRQTIVTLIISTFIFVYFLFGESYQFYYIVNFYDDSIFVFSPDEKVWELESDSPRTRTRNNYYTLTILARFWHYIFIFVGWVFFMSKVIESKRIRYTFLSFSTQNYILFYILAWLSMSNWIKWTFRRFMDTPYYWFINDYRQPYFGIFKNVISSYIMGLLKDIKSNLSITKWIQAFGYNRSYNYSVLSPYSYGRGTYLEYYLSQLI